MLSMILIISKYVNNCCNYGWWKCIKHIYIYIYIYISPNHSQFKSSLRRCISIPLFCISLLLVSSLEPDIILVHYPRRYSKDLISSPRSREQSLRSHEGGYRRSTLIDVFSWISAIDLMLQLIRPVWLITTTLAWQKSDKRQQTTAKTTAWIIASFYIHCVRYSKDTIITLWLEFTMGISGCRCK